MKLLKLSILICLSFTLNGQQLIPITRGQLISLDYDCGTWEQDTTYTTEWMPIDTLGEAFTDARDWVYDDERCKTEITVTADFAPCGRGAPDVYETIRICSLTGIREKQQRVITYRYVPKPLTPYQQTLNQFKQ